jgi:hypothetical protein
VDRLRDIARLEDVPPDFQQIQWLLDAANEIERLRAEAADKDFYIIKESENVAQLSDEIERLREELKLGMIKAGTTILDKEAEIERLRSHIAKLEAWEQEGEALLGQASKFGPDGNVMVRAGAMFKLGAWWADRPWRRDVPDAD